MSQRAILVRSPTRFEAFKQKLTEKGVSVTVIDFDDPEWIFTDFDAHDFLIYYPSFERVSAHPLSLSRVRDHLNFIAQESPSLALYPDVNGVYYYGDKFRQHLHLKKHGFPTPETIPLYSPESVGQAAEKLGFPMVVKNRFGAGGDYVLLVQDRKELAALYRRAAMDYSSMRSIWALTKSTLLRREFYYWWLKRKELNYPFLSHPLLAQKFQAHERDLKVVVGDSVA
ncbi:MAG: ATP-grasp domain-containing protein, partial [Pseudomonadales bacterium]